MPFSWGRLASAGDCVQANRPNDTARETTLHISKRKLGLLVAECPRPTRRNPARTTLDPNLDLGEKERHHKYPQAR
jgi:hypothetical protein